VICPGAGACGRAPLVAEGQIERRIKHAEVPSDLQR
jgi:hypothetical protein